MIFNPFLINFEIKVGDMDLILLFYVWKSNFSEH